jgi:hypothetical protein
MSLCAGILGPQGAEFLAVAQVLATATAWQIGPLDWRLRPLPTPRARFWALARLAAILRGLDGTSWRVGNLRG